MGVGKNGSMGKVGKDRIGEAISVNKYFVSISLRKIT
jgi:hypothetical protein